MIMVPVPSTPTATDALLARKQILDENTLLIQQNHRIKAELNLHEAALMAVREELAARGTVALTSTQAQEAIDRRAAQLVIESQSRIDLIQKRKTELEGAIPDLEERHVTLTNRIASATEEEQNLARERAVAVATHNAWKQEQEAEQAQIAEATHAALQEFEAVTRNTEILKGEQEKREAYLLGKEKHLGERGRDLAIYEDRIRRAAAALTPPMLIHLTDV